MKSQARFNHPRVLALLAIRRSSIGKLTQALPGPGAAPADAWGPRHVAFVLRNEREGSEALLQALRREFGEDGWAYITGASDRLPEPAEQGAARAA